MSGRQNFMYPQTACSGEINIQYTYIVGKYKIYLYELQKQAEQKARYSSLFRSEYKRILYLMTMYVYCVYPAMSKKPENLSDLNKKDRNKHHSSPFINVVKVVFFVVRVTLVPVSYLSAPSAVHSYRVQGKFIRLIRIKQTFIRIAYLYSKCTDCRINIMYPAAACPHGNHQHKQLHKLNKMLNQF